MNRLIVALVLPLMLAGCYKEPCYDVLGYSIKDGVIVTFDRCNGIAEFGHIYGADRGITAPTPPKEQNI